MFVYFYYYLLYQAIASRYLCWLCLLVLPGRERGIKYQFLVFSLGVDSRAKTKLVEPERAVATAVLRRGHTHSHSPG